jgi:hypothetical protein
MEITPIGWVLIPLGLLFFIIRPKWLYGLTIFFAPFSATAIVNRGSGDAASGFSPYLFFGFLMLLRECFGIASRMKISAPRGVRQPIKLLFIFLAVCIASLIMPLIINGNLYVMSSPTLDYNLVRLQYNFQIVNHALSLVFEILIATLIAYRNLDLDHFYTSVRIYLISGVFVCLWGWMQFVLYLIQIPYPAAVFNNNASPYTLGYSAVVDSVNIVRVSSVAIEPSFLSRVLVAMLAMCLVAVYRKVHLFGKSMDYALLLLLASTIILTTASTGYLGVAALLVLWLFLPSAHRRARIIAIVSVLALLITIVVLYFTVPSVTIIVAATLLDKTASGSALERALIVYNDLQYFLQYPLLGIGWDCAPTHDLIIGMLANCGILGLSAFSSLIGTVIYKLRTNFREPATSGIVSTPSIMMFLCLSVTCVVYIISGGIEPPDFWVVLGLSIAAVGIGYNQIERICRA